MSSELAWSPARKALWGLLAALLGPLWLWAAWLRLRGSGGLLQDFAQEWLSARNYAAGLPVYAPLAESISRHLGSGWQVGLMDVNAHPPGSVLFCLPWAALDYRSAYLAWLVLSVVALVAAGFLLWREGGLGLSRWALLPALTVLVTSNSWAQELNQGQWNSILLLLIVGAWAALRGRPDEGRPDSGWPKGTRRGEWIGGGLLGLAGALKLYPAFLLLYLVARRRWRGLAAGLGVLLGWNALALLVLGSGAFRAYVFDVLPALARFRDFWPNASLTGLWSKLFLGASGHVEPVFHSPLLAGGLTVAGVLALAGLVFWRIGGAGPLGPGAAGHDLAFSLCIVAMLLGSPVAWDHYFLVLALPLLALWVHSPRGSWRRGVVVASAVGLWIVNPAWIYRWLLPGPGELDYLRGGQAAVASPAQTLTVLSFQLYLLLVLGVALYAAVPGRKWGREPA
jgi:hypothetical protein